MLGTTGRLSRALIPWLLGALLIELSAGVVASSETFRACVNAVENGSAEQNIKESLALTARDSISIYERCTGYFISQNGEPIIAAFTIILALSTIALWSATRGLVRSADLTAQRQLRAYIAMETGEVVLQNRKLRFETRPVVINTGQTPAKNVRIVSKTDIVPFPVPSGTITPIIAAPNGSVVTLGQRQSRFTNSIMARRVSAQELRAIVTAPRTSTILVYGTVTYDDIFGQPHYTNFAFSVLARRRERLNVWNALSEHNDSD